MSWVESAEGLAKERALSQALETKARETGGKRGRECGGRGAPKAKDAIARLRFDPVMLDIQMPGLSGLAVAGELDNDDRPEIVLVTAFEHFAPDAFEVEAVDYLLKPVRFDRLRLAVDRARRRREGRLALTRNPVAVSEYDDAVWVATRRGQVRVPLDLIDLIEAAGDYAMLHTKTQACLYRTNMRALEKWLDPGQLRRVH